MSHLLLHAYMNQLLIWKAVFNVTCMVLYMESSVQCYMYGIIYGNKGNNNLDLTMNYNLD